MQRLYYMEMNPYKNRFVLLFTVTLFILLSVSGIAFSVYLFVVANSAYMYILAVLFCALSLIAGFFNIFASFLYYRSHFYYEHLKKLAADIKPLRSFPTVAIAVPVYNEEVKLVEKNLLRLKGINYPKAKVRFYVLDDSTVRETVDALRSFAGKNGMTYIHRDDRSGFKAGALNNMLKQCKEDYLAIFDSDERLTNRNFLVDLLPYFNEANISYVQTEKSNSGGSFFSDSVNLFDSFFFRFIQPARALDNTSIFSGSCGIIRRSALGRIGGFPEYIIEDTFFSFESDLHNYKSIYIPKIYAYGKPVTTFTALVKQQWRYNYGDTQFLTYFFKKRTKEFKHRSPLSNIDYMTHGFGLNYLSLILVLFTLVSILIVFSNLPFIHLTLRQALQTRSAGLDLELFGAFAFVLSLFVPVILAKIYFKSLSKGFMVFILNFSLAIVRTKAAVAAVLNSSPGMRWSRTTENNSHNIAYSLYNTRFELAFSAALFSFGYLAVATHNISGGIWLSAYGVLYLAATVLIYKYG
ncbi:MAG: glycosyltransferase [Candidatus Micrarchaeaceae archaeon]|jgi:cellulose synthase (UDP-forming)